MGILQGALIRALDAVASMSLNKGCAPRTLRRPATERSSPVSRRAFSVSACLFALVIVPVIAPLAVAGPRVPTDAIRGPWTSRTVEATAPIGAAFAISRNDANDVKGDLDLRSMKVSRGKAKDTIAFSTYDAVSNAAIDGDGNFAVLIDTNNDRRYDFGQYVFFAAGRLRGLLVNLRTDRIVDRTAPASRSNAKAFRTAIVRSKIDSPGTYRVALFGYNEGGACSPRNPCVDTIPNRFPLIALDHRAPTVNPSPMETYSGDVSDDLTSPLSFTFSDDTFGTGVKRWIVERKAVDAGAGWKAVKTGTIADPTVGVPGAQGITFDVRVVVIDKQKNRKVSSVELTSFPFDDRNAEVAYVGSTIPLASSGAFLDTTTSLALGSTATLTFTGAAELCVMGGPVATGMTATADLTIDSVNEGTATETDTTTARERVRCVSVGGAGAHTAQLTGTTAVAFVLDGLYVAR